MTLKKDENTLIISGRIDSTNASEFEKLLFEESRNIDGDIILDGDNLEYVSSAGLRVFLKLKKQINKKLIIINVSSEVYDIFEVTGFTNLLDVQKKLREISTENMEVLGSGQSGTVYRMDADTIVKVYSSASKPKKIKAERENSRKAFLKGIPTAIAYDFVKANGYYGIVYEMINAKTLAQVIEEEPYKLEYYAKKCAKLLKQLHTTEFEYGELPDAKKFFRRWIDITEEYTTAEEREKLHTIIDRIPSRNTFVHGDFHVSNIMLQDGELMLIDVGDSSLGHPIMDFVGMSLIYKFLQAKPEGLYETTRMTPEQADTFFDVFLKTYFNTDDDVRIKKYTDEIMYFGHLKHVWGLIRLVKKRIPPDIRKMLIEQSKKDLLEGIDKEYSILKDI